MYCAEKESYILSEDFPYMREAEAATVPVSAAVAAHLYYAEDMEEYMPYLLAVPESIDVYIISSREEILCAARQQGKPNFHLLKKENRGRDISALLVAFREISLRYEYICFVHDKKAKYLYLKEDVAVWRRNLWENSIASKVYIHNILDLFAENKDIGLLAPPAPVGEYISGGLGDLWCDDYALTVALAHELQLETKIAEEKQPRAVSTVFWARTCALEKLLKREWRYEDFPEEPLPNDGTISHAIERVLEYVVQDAGFRTEIVMSQSYARWYLSFLEESMRVVYAGEYSRKLELKATHDMRIVERQKQMLSDFCSYNQMVYLYGAGVYGRRLLKRMRVWRLEPAGFVVSDGQRIDSEMDGLRVYELHELKAQQDAAIIISTNFDKQAEMEATLQRNGFSNYILGFI